MKVAFSTVDKNIIDVIDAVSENVDRKKVAAYVVGGLVRDIILGRENFDLDVVVEGDAISLAKSLAKANRAKVKIYREFSTATVIYDDGLEVDFTMARKERYSRSGALPKVAPGTIRDDLFRRDFTINALAVTINEDPFGEVVDFYDGLRDLRKGKIRILHDKSFVDDPTRILRAIRFERRLGFSMERKTLKLLRDALMNNTVDEVKSPRYFSEFRKMLKEPFVLKCLRRLCSLGGFEFFKEGFCPNLRLLKRIERRIARLHEEFFYKNLDWSAVYLMALFDKVSVLEIKQMASKFHLTKGEKELLLGSREIPEFIARLRKKNLRPSHVYWILHNLPIEIVCFIRVQTSSSAVGAYIDAFLLQSRFVKLSITGDDLKKHGISSGKRMGVILDNILSKKINGELRTRKEELKEVKKLMR